MVPTPLQIIPERGWETIKIWVILSLPETTHKSEYLNLQLNLQQVVDCMTWQVASHSPSRLAYKILPWVSFILHESQPHPFYEGLCLLVLGHDALFSVYLFRIYDLPKAKFVPRKFYRLIANPGFWFMGKSNFFFCTRFSSPCSAVHASKRDTGSLAFPLFSFMCFFPVLRNETFFIPLE